MTPERCDCGKNLPRPSDLRWIAGEQAEVSYICGCGMQWDLSPLGLTLRLVGPALNPITGRQPEVN